MRNYFLKSERLGFRFWTADDLPLAASLWGNPEVTRLFVKEPLTDWQVRERLERELENARLYGVQYWPAFTLDAGLFTGCCGLRPCEGDDHMYELGYHLIPDAWGRGFATEAGEAVVRYAFSKPGIHRLCAGHHPENHASGRVLLKLGFTRTGETFFEPTGLLHPSYLLENPHSAMPLP